MPNLSKFQRQEMQRNRDIQTAEKTAVLILSLGPCCFYICELSGAYHVFDYYQAEWFYCCTDFSKAIAAAENRKTETLEDCPTMGHDEYEVNLWEKFSPEEWPELYADEF